MDLEIIEPCAVRLRKALSIRNMTQSELCAKVNISKSTLSEYLNGRYEPKQDRVFIISQALSVDPVWLMGYDVPMEKPEGQQEQKSSPAELQLSEGEKMLLDLFNRVPEDQQQLVLQMIRAALGTQE